MVWPFDYFQKATGKHYRAASARGSSKAYEKDLEMFEKAVGELTDIAGYEGGEIKEITRDYNHGKLTARQYGKLVRDARRRFAQRIGGLEKFLKGTTLILILGALFLVGDMGSMAITGNAILAEGARAASFSVYGVAFVLVAFLILFRHHLVRYF